MKASAAMIDAASPPFMSQAPRPIYLAVADHPGKRLDRPVFAGLDHIDVGIEVDAGTGPPPVAARHNVDPRKVVAVARRPLGAEEARRKAAPGEPRGEEFCTGAVGRARRIDGGEADELGRQLDELIGAGFDGPAQPVLHRPS